MSLKPGANTYTCPSHELTGKDCKHILAALFVRERDYAGQKLLIDTNTLPAKKTYKQNWPAYNEAQTQEKNRLQVLLADICRNVQNLPKPKKGRAPHLGSDSVFAMALKVYSTFSSRRFHCDLQEAHQRGHTTVPVPGMKVNAFMENEFFTPILKDLIIRSSLPLKAVDVDFAADSSGFSTSRFVKWFDEKYGRTRSGHEWVKVHIMTGVKTNVVTAVEILGKDAADCPQFGPLMKTTAQNFKVREVSGDKAYLSRENLELVEDMGGTAYIPFKSNCTSGNGTDIWSRMFGYFQFRRDEFLQHYHKRSNVESTFSMVKAKFQDSVRSRSDVAMVNEVLCKLLCHNICCVIQAQCELGIEATFWPQETSESHDVLPLARPS